MGKATEDLLEELHGSLAKAMKDRLAEGTASASDLNVIRQFLKDNGIEGVAKAGSPLGDLVNQLPDIPDDDDENVVPLTRP